MYFLTQLSNVTAFYKQNSFFVGEHWALKLNSPYSILSFIQFICEIPYSFFYSVDSLFMFLFKPFSTPLLTCLVTYLIR